MGSYDGGNGGEAEEAFTGQAATSYDHGHDGEVLYQDLQRLAMILTHAI
jgi:hypothetical protein